VVAPTRQRRSARLLRRLMAGNFFPARKKSPKSALKGRRLGRRSGWQGGLTEIPPEPLPWLGRGTGRPRYRRGIVRSRTVRPRWARGCVTALPGPAVGRGYVPDGQRPYLPRHATGPPRAAHCLPKVSASLQEREAPLTCRGHLDER